MELRGEQDRGGFLSIDEPGGGRFPLSTPGDPAWGAQRGDVKGRRGLPRGSAGSQLPALQSVFPLHCPLSPVTGDVISLGCATLCWRHEVCPSGLAQPAGWIPYGLCKGQAKAPFHPAPCPLRSADPDDLLSPGHCLWLVAPARWGCHPAAWDVSQRVRALMG